MQAPVCHGVAVLWLIPLAVTCAASVFEGNRIARANEMSRISWRSNAKTQGAGGWCRFVLLMLMIVTAYVREKETRNSSFFSYLFASLAAALPMAFVHALHNRRVRQSA